MSIFRRKKAVDPERVINHLVAATVKDYIIGTDEAAEHAASHIAADLRVLDRDTLCGIAGVLIITAAHQTAQAAQAGVLGLVKDLLGAMAPEEGQEPADGPEAPTDLLEDTEPTTDAQAAAEGLGWAEDRR